MAASDVFSNYVEATVTTSLNGTDAPGTSDNVTVSAVSAAWVSLTSGTTQLRVMDKADLGLSSGYEIMILTADNSGSAGTWTLTRGAESSTVHAHSANWTLVPANTAGALSGLSVIQVSSQTGASYTFVLTDAGTVVEGNSASAQTFTIPPHSSVAFPVGAVIEVFQEGAGQITIAAGVGVTLQSDGSKVKCAAQYSTIGLRQRATDTWVLSGDLA